MVRSFTVRETTLTEVAELLDLTKSSIQTHVERGLQRLRNQLAGDRDG